MFMIIRLLSSLACCFALFANGMSGPASAAVSDAAKFSDRQIFEGVVLGEGPAGTLLYVGTAFKPVSSRLNGMKKAAYLAAIATTERRLDARDHGILHDFARDMTSGDPGLVEQMLVRTRADFVNLTHSSKMVAAAPTGRPNDFQLVNIAAEANYGFAVNVAAVTNVAFVYLAGIVYIAGALVVVFDPLTAPQTAFQTDCTAARVAQRLDGVALAGS